MEVMRTDLSREMKVWGSREPPIVVASDGRLDEHAASIAVVVIDGSNGTRRCVLADIPPGLREKWRDLNRVEKDEDRDYHYIALVEQAAVVLGVCEFAQEWAGRDVVWFIDNLATLAGLAKGHNHNAELDNANAFIHVMLAHMKTRCWWEYISSKANWADGPSREMEGCEWLREENFEVWRGEVIEWPWEECAGDRPGRIKALLDAAMGECGSQEAVLGGQVPKVWEHRPPH